MRAWQTTRTGKPTDALELNHQTPKPEPRDGTVQIQVQAAGIGLPDVLMCQGKYAMTPGTFPFTQGQEVVGHVVGWGDDVTGRKLGDRVMGVTSFFTGHGGFAEECLVLDGFCLPVPNDMTDAEAAGFLIPFHTAYIALVTRGHVEEGETLLVIGGAGGTGQAAIQVGKALGATVIATAGSPDKVEFCRELGADHVVNYRHEEIAEAVNALTGGHGADAIYDPVGGEAFEKATRCVAHEGRILAIGFASGSWGKTDTAHLVQNNYSVVGVIPSKYDRPFKEEVHSRLLAWRGEGKLVSRVDELVGFEDLPNALERLAKREVKGKLVLSVGSLGAGTSH
ncbi:MAG: alcohol dehydrogenase [Deltaproteobacteria bacterium]|nr:alcohol dehydrogenase [Deltaproteobacteria bacterium]